jgi:lipid-A-disaccharide synthase
MRYYIIVGEASGDMYGAELMKNLISKDSNAHFRFCGGDKMCAENNNIFRHYSENNYMGFLEVAIHAKSILKYIKDVKDDIKNYKPDLIVLIDYPGFNLKIAKFAKSLDIPVHYYISPKIWAWKEKRIHKIIKYVDHMYSIFPFEVDFYKKFNYTVDYVGNPLMDQIYNFKATENYKLNFTKPVIAILPGSRKGEIKKMLPIFYQFSLNYPNYDWVIAGAPSIPESFYREFVGEKTKIVFNQTYDLLNVSHCALVTSGTATLETALFKVPQIVCYKISVFTYTIIKFLIKIKYISLVNLILNKECVKELIQNDLNLNKLNFEFNKLINQDFRKKQLKDYETLHNKLGKPGASELVAEKILYYSKLNQ